MSQFTCPECGAALKLPVPVAPGRAIRCPKCQAVFAAAGGPAPVPLVKRSPPPPADIPVRNARPQPKPDPPARPHRSGDADGHTRRGIRTSGSRRVRFAVGLLGIGAVLLIVGLVLALKLFGGDGEKKGDKKDNPQVAQGDRTPGGNNQRPDLPIEQRPEGPPGKPPVDQPLKIPIRPPDWTPPDKPQDKPPEKPPDKPPDKPSEKPPSKPPLVQKEPDEGLDLPAPKSLGDDRDRPLLTLDARGHTARSLTVLFTPDGKQVVTAGADKAVRVWDIATGETAKIFYLPAGAGDEGSLSASALSHDGKKLAVTGIPLGRGEYGILIYILSLKTGQLEQVLKGHSAPVLDMVFSRDGRVLYTLSNDKTARAFETRTGDTLRAFPAHPDRPRGLAVSPDDRWLATGCEDRVVRLWSLATRANPIELRGHNAPVLSVAFSPDSRTVAAGSFDGVIRLWALDGTPKKTLHVQDTRKHPLQVTSLNYTRDGKELLYTGIAYTGTAGLVDVDRGTSRLVFDKHTNTVTDGRLSSDSKLAVSIGGDDNEAFVWKTEDGSVVRRLTGAGKPVLATAWSPDGKTIAWGSINRADASGLRPLEHTFRLADFDFGGKPTDRFVADQHQVGAYTLTALDFYKIAIRHNGRIAQVWQSKFKGDRIYSFSIIPGDRAVMGGSFGLYLVDLKTGRTVREFVGHSGMVWSVSPSPNGRYFMTGCTDQVLSIWHPNRTEPILSFFFAGRDWIAWTPEGYYAASANGERLMGWLIVNGPDKLSTFYPAARFRASLYNPAALRLLLRPAGGHIERALALAGKPDRPVLALNVGQVLPPDVVIKSPAPETQLAGGEVEVKAVATSKGAHPVTALRLLVDGRPYRGSAGIIRPPAPKLGAIEAKWTVELPPGKHIFAVQAESKVSKGLSRPVEVVRAATDEPELPNLYILACGVSAYPGPLRLRYAASDARLITMAFRKKASGVFNKVEVRLQLDRQATRSGIREGLEWLEKSMTPKDVGIFFFSGHGGKDDDGNFFMVPVDIGPDLAATGVSGEFVKEKLANMSGRLVCMLDCCHSGAVATDGRKPGQADDLVRDLVTEDYGVICMCSSLGSEYSMESPLTGAGFFTRSVVDGLAGAADLDHDRIIYIHELDYYAAQRVRELSNGEQNPVTARPTGVHSFPLARP
ncbi:MAG: caspase family protein [Planctomycetes bacterium]|nr:caspase family protein [Planctomycetota bacterium]